MTVTLFTLTYFLITSLGMAVFFTTIRTLFYFIALVRRYTKFFITPDAHLRMGSMSMTFMDRKTSFSIKLSITLRATKHINEIYLKFKPR